MGIGSWYGVDGVTILMMDLVDGSLLLRQMIRVNGHVMCACSWGIAIIIIRSG
jgi:hypothetical protein